MPKALSIETSGRNGSVALSDNGRILREEEFHEGLKHASGLVPMIDRLCQSVGWTAFDIKEIHVSAGPGSFTGLRVGITVAKTLAFTTGAKLIAVPTVEVLARNTPIDASNIIIVLDAKRGQIFTGRLTRTGDDDWVQEEPAHLDTLSAMLDRSPRPVYLIGEGIPWHRDSIPAGDNGVIVAPELHWRARAGVAAEIGHAMARAGLFVNPVELAPIYIRKPEAEEKYEAGLKRA